MDRNLPKFLGEKELRVLRDQLGWAPTQTSRWLLKSHSSGHSGKFTTVRTLINTLGIVPGASGRNDIAVV